MNRIQRRLFIQSLEDRTAPATFTVMNLNDSGADSLRDCLGKANAAAGADTIDFKSGLTGAITLTTGEIAIQDAVSILGPGSATLSISGKNTSRIFNTSTAPAGTAINISGLTLSNGKADKGGAMLLGDESLTLNQCVMTGNSATIHGGAMNASGASTVTANGCTFTNNSATYSAGVLLAINSAVKTVWNSCTISGNTCQVGGGGIYVGGDLLVEQCTISNNQTTSFVGRGAGILASGTFSSLIIRNSTISGNTSSKNGGGIELVYFSGVLSVQNSTITNNTSFSSGGGIHLYSGTGTISLESTIVSGNSSPSEADINCFNKVSMKTSAVGSNKGFTMTDLGGNLPFGAKLNLGPLANNGGPTLTHALKAGSAAFEKGSNPANLTTDQRGPGFVRLDGAAPDIGAFEAKPADMVFKVINANDAGIGSLRQAILDTNANPGSDTIIFDPAFFNVPRTITLLSGQLSINDPVTITGPGAGLVTVSGNNATRVIQTHAAINLSGLTIANGFSTNGGGGISGNGNVTLEQCVLSGNTTDSFGGAFEGYHGATLVAKQTSFTGNKAAKNGGAISSIDGSPASQGNPKVVLTACTLSGNSALIGGGIYAREYLLIEGSTIAKNEANSGGGLYLSGLFSTGAATVRNTTFSGNQGNVLGGGGILLNQFDGELTIQNCTLTNNIALASSGGGIRANNSTGSISLESSIVSGNTGGVADIFTSATVKVKNSAIGSSSGFTMTDLGGNLPFGTNLLLGVLGSNGGPTQTHALLAGSPALNKGSNPAGLTTDQRGTGFPRTADSAADIGAYEAQPMTFVVTNADDSGPGSLRNELLNANANAAADTIIFDPTFFNVPRTIALTTGEIAISDAVTIAGPGAALTTVSGSNFSRIFKTSSAAAGAAINISGLTLTQGKTASDGGAIFVNDEALTLTDCAIIGNSASFGGGIFSNFGTLTLQSCTVADNSASGSGGGINFFQETTLTLQSCTVSGNTAGGAGGGINFLLGGAFTIRDSTVSGNSSNAVNGGGGLTFNDDATGPLLISNSTFSGNTATPSGGGIVLDSFIGTLTVQNSTFTGNKTGENGGGIAQRSGTGSIILESTIVFGNSASGVGPDIASSGKVSAKSCSIFASTGFTLTDLGGNRPFGENPQLGPLANNGGPTLTHVLLGGSPVLNKGSNPGNLITDQRGNGFPRIEDSAIDIGAYEAKPTIFVVTNANDSGAGSLRQAMLNANNNGGLDTITFDPTFFNVPRIIALTSGELQNTDHITIIGPGASLCTVSGNNLGRILDTQQAHGDLPVNISGLTFAFGQLFGVDDGAAIFAADQKLTLNNCVFTSNFATRFGGAIRIGTGNLTATDCTFSNNGATNNAGAIYASTGDVTLRRCSISGNTAGNNGGGVYAYNVGNLLIEDCTFSSNKATSASGGAVLNVRQGGTSQMVVRNSTISANSAGSEGGGLAISADVNLVVQNSTLTANSTTGVGGGIFGPTVVITSSILFGNQANVSGPEIAANTATITTSLVGSKAGVLTFTGDSFTNSNIGINPLLGPLASNGGPTLTHALLAGSPALNSGSNPAGLINDQRGVGFARVAGSAADIGAFESQAVAPPVAITSVQINDGSAQRSRVTSLQVTFNTQITFAGAVAGAFTLTRNGGGAVGGFTATANNVGGVTVVTLSGFTGAETQSGSLADGLYTLTVLASQILGFDGNGDGTPGDNFVLVGDTTTNKLFRLFGDADGNGTVTAADFNAFRLSYGSNGPSIFDFDNDGQVSAADFNQFRLRYGLTLTP